MIGSRAWPSPGGGPSFWMFAAGYFVILTALPLGGFPTGWTGYAPLQTQAAGGMDSYLVGFARDRYRHDPGRVQSGRHHHQLPGPGYDLGPGADLRLVGPRHRRLLTLATPTLVAAGLFGILDRTAQTAFFVNEHGGS